MGLRCSDAHDGCARGASSYQAPPRSTVAGPTTSYLLLWSLRCLQPFSYVVLLASSPLPASIPFPTLSQQPCPFFFFLDFALRLPRPSLLPHSNPQGVHFVPQHSLAVSSHTFPLVSRSILTSHLITAPTPQASSFLLVFVLEDACGSIVSLFRIVEQRGARDRLCAFFPGSLFGTKIRTLFCPG